MIEPTADDIGRRVQYLGEEGPHSGVIKSFNDHYVFVQYDGESAAKATVRGLLKWHDPARHSAVPADDESDDDSIGEAVSDVLGAVVGGLLSGDDDDGGFKGGGGGFGGGGSSGSW